MMDNVTPTNALEVDFLDVLRSYYRRAGCVAATALLGRLADAADDGASRNELARIAAQALAELPTVH
jgi:hypothetical protein